MLYIHQVVVTLALRGSDMLPTQPPRPSGGSGGCKPLVITPAVKGSRHVIAMASCSRGCWRFSLLVNEISLPVAISAIWMQLHRCVYCRSTFDFAVDVVELSQLVIFIARQYADARY